MGVREARSRLGAPRWPYSRHVVCVLVLLFSSVTGFLDEEVPLQVLATTPMELMTEISDPEPVWFSQGEQGAITVVFSRAVVALGSDFGFEELPEELVPFNLSNPEQAPGRFRWVSTSIARFDPVGAWAPDLDLKLTWNKNMMTYDGIPLNITFADAKIRTGSLELFLRGVASEKARNLTDDHWDGDISLQDGEEGLYPEAPPDAMFVVEFSFPVQLDLLEDALEVFKVHFEDGEGNESAHNSTEGDESKKRKVRDETDIEFEIVQCHTLDKKLVNKTGPVEADCAVIKLVDADLEMDTRYEMVLPAGTQYSKRAGDLTEELFFEFYGLRRFTIPFLNDFENMDHRNLVSQEKYFPYDKFVRSRTLLIWLPHGLAEGTDIEELADLFLLERLRFRDESAIHDMRFNLTQRDKGILEFRAKLEPAQKYRITVNGSSDIRDGFGLPLEPSNVTFVTLRPSDEVASLHEGKNVVLEASQKWNGTYPILSFGWFFHPMVFRAWAVDVDDEDAKLTWAHYLFFVESENDPPFPADLKVEMSSTNVFGVKFEDAEMRKLLNKSGMVYYRRPGPEAYEPPTDAVGLINEVDFQVGTVEYRLGSDQILLLAVTSTLTGDPLDGTEIEVMRRPDKAYDEPKMEFIETLVTDEDGAVEFTRRACNNTDFCDQYVFLVKHEGRVLMFEKALSEPYEVDWDERVSIVLDRKLVEPGKQLRIGGFLVSRNGTDISPTPAENYTLTFEASFTIYESEELGWGSLTVPVNPKYGTFEASFTIPENAAPGEYSVNGIEYFTVGEPRLPTTSLELITPLWARWNSTVDVEVLAASLIGGAIAGTDMTLTWFSSRDAEKRVIVDFQTNATGGARIPIDLTEADPVLEEGDTLNLVVTWIGPTRETTTMRTELRVQRSPRTLSLQRSITMDLPGMEFGVWAKATEVVPEETIELDGIKVDLTLYQAADDLQDDELTIQGLEDNPGNKTYGLRSVSECVIRTGDIDSVEKCRMVMPDFGVFVLRGCMEDEVENVEICSVQIFGRKLTTWERSPLKLSHTDIYYRKGVEFVFHPKSGKIDHEKNAIEISVDMPFNGSYILAFWGSDVIKRKKIFTFPDSGVHKMELEADDACLGGCSVHFFVATPRQNSSVLGNVPYELSADPEAPLTVQGSSIRSAQLDFTFDGEDVPFTMNVTIGIQTEGEKKPVFNYPDSDVEYEPPVLAPGENATLVVNVTKCPGNPTNASSIGCEKPVPAADAEVLVIAVDKAYFFAQQYPLPDLRSDLQMSFASGSVGVESPFARFTDPASMKMFQSRVSEFFDVDPWVLSVLTNNYDAFIEGGTLDEEKYSLPVSELLKEIEMSITRDPPNLGIVWGYLGRIMQQPRARTGASARSPDEEKDPKLRKESEFKTTPVFEVIKTKADGSGKATFTAPANLGTFVVRAFAVSEWAQHGSAESELIVRLPLSLSSSAPRFVRVGDKFEAGVVIRVSGKKVENIPITVTLLSDPDAANDIEYVSESRKRRRLMQECEDVACMVTLDQKTMKTDEDGQIEVRFDFKAVRTGAANLTIRADAPGGSDALMVTVPVLGQQEPVQLASSFSLEATTEKNQWEEGLKFPDAVPGSGKLDLVAGVGSFPAVVEISKRIMKPSYSSPDGSIANLTVVAILQQYGADDPNSPENGLFENATHSFRFSLEELKLGELTSDRRGLMWSWEMHDSPHGADLYLNSMGAWAVDQLLSKLDTEKDALFSTGMTTLSDLSSRWKGALANRTIAEAKSSREDGEKIYLSSVLNARFALGTGWTPEVEDVLLKEDLDINRLSKKLKDLSTSELARVALIQLQELGWEEGKRHPDVEAILDSFQSQLRVQGRTAYIAESGGSSSPAGPVDQALVLLVFVRTGLYQTNPLVEKFVKFVGSSGQYGCPFERVAKLLALSEYDKSLGSSEPDLSVKARSGNATLLKADFQSPTDPIATSSTPFDDLSSPPDPLMFSVQGQQGEASIVAALNFVPGNLLPYPTYRGLFVERVIQAINDDGEPEGPALQTFRLTDTYLVTVQVTTPDSLGAVEVRVMMPGGIEPVFQVGATCTLQDLGFVIQQRAPFCPTQVTSPEAVTFHYSKLYPGTTSVSFPVIAASVGEWVLPPVQATATQQPEVMGLSKAGNVTVCDRMAKSCKAKAAPAEKPVKSCPNNCSRAGDCNLDTGECLCQAGFKGDDCSELEES